MDRNVKYVLQVSHPISAQCINDGIFQIGFKCEGSHILFKPLNVYISAIMDGFSSN